MTPSALQALEKETDGRLHIGYLRCKYERHISVLCFKCRKFGHKAADCKATEKEIKDIHAWHGEGKCSNCILKQIDARKKELKKEELSPAEKQAVINGINHKTFDVHCPAFTTLQGKLASRYNYGSSNLPHLRLHLRQISTTQQ
ncbi:UNVERIFIED_CONTAM: hypothetical protein PYX00_008247 [Menopon gallinae]|uniref:CCHC-type domain-containing protein n=1 Tax=Menopon gallinae TaxID=328185 RepID=A0AAW2HNG8_9NEOP